MKQNCPRTLKIHKSTQNLFFYVLNNDFSYTQLSLGFAPHKDSYYVHDFGICLKPFFSSFDRF